MTFDEQSADDDDGDADALSHRGADVVAVAPSGTPGAIDHRRHRRLGHLEQCIWYVLAAVTYIGLGVFHKFLFNWFIGSIWLIAVVVIGPALCDWLRRRTRAGA